MKINKNITRVYRSLFLILILFATQTYAQEFNLNNASSDLTVFGTSNLHDWDVKAEKQSGKIVLDTGNQIKIKQLKFVVDAESLKSGKKSMDNNTYKALNTKKYKNISFDLKEVKSISDLGNNRYKVNSTGSLSIAGVTKQIPVEFTMERSANRVVLKGKKTFKMTDFGVEPPKALLGTVTTGDEVTIDFNTVLNK